MKLYFTLLLVAVTCFGFAQTSYHDKPSFLQHTKTNNTSIVGVVDDPTDSKVTIRFYKNNISFAEELIVVPIQEDNTFDLSFSLVEPATAFLTYNDEEIKLYIEPGDDLKLSFDGDDFLSKLEFEGKGKEHNTYMLKAYKKFKELDKDYLLYEMDTRESNQFRAYLDDWRKEKWNFFQKYNKEKTRFTKEFVNYAYADIDYWWAYNLINYRIERPRLKGQPIPMDLPDDYYSFLKELVISNDNALNNRYYLEFLEEYVKLRQEKPTLGKVFQSADKFYIVEAAVAMIMEKPDTPPIIDQPVQGTRLKYLNKHSDFKSKGILHGRTYEDYWYQIETQDGKKGWVLGIGVKPANTVSDAPIATTEQTHVGRIERYAVTIMHNVALRDEAHSDKKILTTLPYGMELENLRNKTSETFKYEQNGKTYIEHFHKVKTPGGMIGWLPSVAIELKERKISNDDGRVMTTSLTNTRNAEKYLNGKSLQYILAKGLFWKTHLHDLDAVGREIAEYQATNQYEVYNKILTAAYEVGQLRGKGDRSLVDSYTYSVIGSPLIKGLGMPVNYVPTSKKTKRKSTQPKRASRYDDYVEIDSKGAKRSATKTILKGKVMLPTSQKAELIIHKEPILFEEEKYNLSGNFEIDIDLVEPITAVLRYGDEEINLYLEPGDKLDIRASGTNLLDLINIDGKGSQHNKYLLESQKAFAEIHAEMINEVRHSEDADFKEFMKAALKKKRSYLKKYQGQSAFTNKFSKYIKADIDYWYAYNMFNYTLEHPMHQPNPQDGRMQVSKKYYNFINDVQLAQDGVLNNSNYTYFLNEYFSYMSEKEEHNSLTTKELGEQFLTNEPYYYHKAKELAVACKRGKTKEVGPEIAGFIKECPYERYNDVLRFVYNESKELLVGSTAPDFEVGDIDGNMISLSDLKGKVVFLDFWATWCTPCVRSLLHSQRIKEQFKDKDVVFMYIALDDDQKVWKDYVKQNDLKGLHVYAKGGMQNSQVAKLYKVAHLPTFIMVDQEGKIAFNPAKNPGNSQLINQINGLLGNPKF